MQFFVLVKYENINNTVNKINNSMKVRANTPKLNKQKLESSVFGRAERRSSSSFIANIFSDTPSFKRARSADKRLLNLHQESTGTPIFSANTPNGTKVLSRKSSILIKDKENLSQENIRALIFSPAVKSKQQSFITKSAAAISSLESLIEKFGSYEKSIESIVIDKKSLQQRSKINRKTVKTQRSVMRSSPRLDILSFIQSNSSLTRAEKSYLLSLLNQRKVTTKDNKTKLVHDFEYLHLCAYSLSPLSFNPQTVENLVVGHKDSNTNMIFWAERIAEALAKLDKKVQLDITAKCIEGTHIAYEINYKFAVDTRSFSTKFNPLNPKPKARRSDALLYLRSLVKTLDDKPTLGKRNYSMELRPQKRLNYNYK